MIKRPAYSCSIAVFVFATSCSGPVTSGADTGTTLMDVPLSEDTMVPVCVSTIPCTTDLQCASLPGYQCNLGLSSPRCQRIECGEIGTPCAPADIGGRFGNGAEEALCQMRSCRHVQPGPWTCRVEPLTQAECVAICGAARQMQSCGTDVCDAACTMGLNDCATHRGLSDIYYGTICSAAAVRTCGDGTIVRN